MEWVALLGGVLLCLPAVEVLEWPEAVRVIPWNAIVLMMASLGLGQMMYETGAARWLAWEVLGGVGALGPVVRIAVVVAAMLIIKIFLASNAVTGTVMIPLFITLAQDLGLDVWSLVAPAALSASLGLVMITESPTNVIPYNHGYFTMRDFIKSGLIMSVIVVAVLTAVIVVVGSLTGMYRL
jgi:sodium-dependent dicarboxylate transporter 2/3/5